MITIPYGENLTLSAQTISTKIGLTLNKVKLKGMSLVWTVISANLSLLAIKKSISEH